MDHFDLPQLVAQVLVVLTAGFVAGTVCQQLRVSLLVGYLVVGSLIGTGGLRLVSGQSHEIELLAEAGALLLLFAVGIEFSIEQLAKLARFFFVGGIVQMTAVAVPLTLTAWLCGLSWPGAILAGTAGALSSTVLVFRALTEVGQMATPHGRRAIGILLFQDVALVPLLLLVPMLTGAGDAPTVGAYGLLAGKSLVFVGGVWALQKLVRQVLIPLIAMLRSVEIVVLFSMCVLGGVSWVASMLGLPAAVGALAAGIILSGNRLSHQIDSIVLPFRETFAAVFFVTLGTLLKPLAFFSEPVLLTVGLIGMLALKTAAAAVALRCVGLSWRCAAGTGLGLAQLGEFSFLLVGEGVRQEIIGATDFNRMLFIALGTLILTPILLRFGLQAAQLAETEAAPEMTVGAVRDQQAIVIGIGPIGRQVASRLQWLGFDAALIDLSPINLQPLAQLGFRTFAGDARDRAVLKRAGIPGAKLAVVCVPADEIAAQLVKALRETDPTVKIVVRCRFEARIAELENLGADRVVSEEAEASGPIVALCEEVLKSP